MNTIPIVDTVMPTCTDCGLMPCPTWCPKNLNALGDWIDFAACADVAPETFFTDEGGPDIVDEAKRICSGCAVQAECLEHALRNNERSGIWGGTTPGERRLLATLRRRRTHERALGERD